MTKSSIFVLFVTLIVILIQCNSVLSDANLISKTCSQTPNPSLCISFLKSDPSSLNADTTKLALIMVNVIKAKATASVNFIHQQIGKSSPELKKSFSSCAGAYNAVLNGGIPSAIEALTKGQPKFGQAGANDAANEATDCENSFHGKSPMTQLNNAVKQSSTIASAIIQLLL
ncbi:cell wall / vacuolar inhibitor of fructosidase 1-like [Mercurialis annua]|uniref:cell wall / vacuolar inhibitor of fructosidase 1-like n=1 Tax=Mercurialis annua TaxID=3986 RepID=UPI002160C634|nr:cell wall / vacuolar inhibitor of fructosidase 1-like [Mercurialis annua]